MKVKLVVIFVTINLVLSKCSVVSSTKNSDSTTPSGNQANFTEKNDKKHEIYKTFNVNESRIYLDDVLFALKNLNWTEDEQPCLERTLLMLQNLQNFTLWAVWRKILLIFFTGSIPK